LAPDPALSKETVADDQVHVWSADPVTWRKVERLGIPASHETRFGGGTVSGRFYPIPVAGSAGA
jgi:hypothetical protein